MSTGVNIVKILSGRVMAQILSFLTVPILTRLFLPEHFGILQIFTSISVIIIPIACLRYEMSIPLAQDDHESLACLVLSAGVALGVALLILPLIIAGDAAIAAWFHAPELARFLWFLPVVVFAGGLHNSLKYWAARTARFGSIALSDLSLSLTDKLIPILWGVLVGVSTLGLFAGRVGSMLISLSVLLIFARQPLSSHGAHFHLHFSLLRSLAIRYKKFPLFSSWGIFLNMLSMQLPALILGSYFSPTIVGYYSLGYNAISFPMNMLSYSIAQVFFPTAAREYQETGTLAPVVSTFFTRLVQVGVFPMMLISLAGVQLFIVVFGQEWSEAGLYARMLAVWWMLAFINAPLRVFDLVNRQEAELLMHVIMLVTRALGLGLAAALSTPRVTLATFVAMSVCCLLGSTIWKLRIAHVSLFWAFRTMVRYIGISGLVLLPVKLMATYIHDLRLILAAYGIATGCYGIVLLSMDNSLKEFIFGFFSNKQDRRDGKI